MSIPLHLLCGLRDDGRERVVLDAAGQPRRLSSGSAAFAEHLPAGRFTLGCSWLDASARPPAVHIGPGALVNHIADADSHRTALTRAAALCAALARPCFNPPERVLRTRRDQVAATLAGIDGLRVPRCVRLLPRQPQDFAAAVAAHALRYPLIVRLAGDHDSVSLLRIDTADDWDTLHALPWGGRAVYLTEWHDYRDDDGLWRKWRLVVVDGEPFLRHVFTGHDWLLSAASRSREPALLAQSERQLARYASELRPQLLPVVAEVAHRLGLHWFGMDVHLAADGQLTLFEANACMDMLGTTPGAPAFWDTPLPAIHAALCQALARFASGGAA